MRLPLLACMAALWLTARSAEAQSLPPPYCIPCPPTDGPPDSETNAQGSLSLVVATEAAECALVHTGSSGIGGTVDWDCEPEGTCQAHFVLDWTLVVTGGVGFCLQLPPCPPVPMTYMSSGSLEDIESIPCGGQASFTGYTTGLRQNLSVSSWASCGQCGETEEWPTGR